jgi:hypothetical protein
MPVALDCLVALEHFALRGRKSGNEYCSLTPLVYDMRCKPDREAGSKADETTSRTFGSSVQNQDHVALRWRYCDALRNSRSCEFMARDSIVAGKHAPRTRLRAPAPIGTRQPAASGRVSGVPRSFKRDSIATRT